MSSESFSFGALLIYLAKILLIFVLFGSQAVISQFYFFLLFLSLSLNEYTILALAN